MNRMTDKILFALFMQYFHCRSRLMRLFMRFHRIKEIFDYCYLRFHGVETSFGFVKLIGYPIIRKLDGSKIVIDKNVTLVSKSQGNFAGINHPVILATLSSSAKIIIRSNVGISGSSICAASEIIIDENAGLGANSSIYDTDFHPIDSGKRFIQTSMEGVKTMPIHIGKDVWINANALILKGVQIGESAIVAANAVVVKNVKEKTLVGGVPAHLIKVL